MCNIKLQFELNGGTLGSIDSRLFVQKYILFCTSSRKKLSKNEPFFLKFIVINYQLL